MSVGGGGKTSGLIPSGATVISGAQASQLMEKLRSQGQLTTTGASTKPGNGGGPIKIQTVQTRDPTTGQLKQILSIPVSLATSLAASSASQGSSSPITLTTTSGGSNTNSPLKVIKVPASQFQGVMGVQGVPTIQGVQTLQGNPPGALKVIQAGTAGTSIQGVQGVQGGVKVVKIASPAAGSTTASTSAGAGIRTTIGGVSGGGSGAASGVANMGASVFRNRHQDLLISRGRADVDFESFSSEAKRRKTEKGGKGLRHFSMKVCEKVQAKGVTSYNEVADELVNELTDPRCTSPTDQQYDQKNIRRRVYDALNVLMAMNIISKEKKEIRWLGLPTNSVQEANGLELDKANRMERIRAKTHQLQDLILQQIAFKNLVERNKSREKKSGVPAPNSAIQLPFIVVNTSKKTVIDCSISNDKMEYLFGFDDTFEIHDDMEVLKRMGLSFGLEKQGTIKQSDLIKAKSMVPRALEQYVTQLAENGPGSCTDMPKVSSPVILKEGGGMIPAGVEIEDSDVDVN